MPKKSFLFLANLSHLEQKNFKKKFQKKFFFENFFEKKNSKFFSSLNDSNLREIQKNFWALSFIAVVFVEFAVVFMNSTANMTKTTAMDSLIVALSNVPNPYLTPCINIHTLHSTYISPSYSLLSKIGVSIKDITQERAWIKNDIFSVEDVVVVSDTFELFVNYYFEVFIYIFSFF